MCVLCVKWTVYKYFPIQCVWPEENLRNRKSSLWRKCADCKLHLADENGLYSWTLCGCMWMCVCERSRTIMIPDIFLSSFPSSWQSVSRTLMHYSYSAQTHLRGVPLSVSRVHQSRQRVDHGDVPLTDVFCGGHVGRGTQHLELSVR